MRGLDRLVGPQAGRRAVDALVHPSQAGSRWARTNKERVARLEAEGRMTRAGRAMIDAAKADGCGRCSTTSRTSSSLTTSPCWGVQRHPGSRENFAGAPGAAARAILDWIVHAKRGTRRVLRGWRSRACLAAQDVRANQWVPDVVPGQRSPVAAPAPYPRGSETSHSPGRVRDRVKVVKVEVCGFKSDCPSSLRVRAVAVCGASQQHVAGDHGEYTPSDTQFQRQRRQGVPQQEHPHHDAPTRWGTHHLPPVARLNNAFPAGTRPRRRTWIPAVHGRCARAGARAPPRRPPRSPMAEINRNGTYTGLRDHGRFVLDEKYAAALRSAGRRTAAA